MAGVLMNDGKVSMLDGKVVMGEVDDNCCCGTHRQARRCRDDFLEDIWMTLADAATLPGSFSLDFECYYFDFSDPPSSTPGTVYTPADVTAYDDCDTCPRCLCGLVIGQTLEVARPTFHPPTSGLSFPCTENLDRYQAVCDILNSLPATLQLTLTGFDLVTGNPIFEYTGAQPTFLGDTPHDQINTNHWHWYWEVPPHVPPAPPIADMIYIQGNWFVDPTVRCNSGSMTIQVSLGAGAEGQTASPPYSGGSCGTGGGADGPTVTILSDGDCQTLNTITWTSRGTLPGWVDSSAGSYQLDAPP